MKSFQKVGAYAALLQGLVFIFIVLFIFGVELPQGIGGPGSDPAKAVAAAASSPAPFLILNLAVMVLSATILLIVLALRDLWQAAAPDRMRLALIGASIASALFLANGVTSFTGFPPIVTLSDKAAAVSGYVILNAVTNGLLEAGIFAAGWTSLMWGWAALSGKTLPTLLTYLVLLASVVAILTFVIPPLGIVGPVINIVWSLWLGMVLMQAKKA